MFNYFYTVLPIFTDKHSKKIKKQLHQKLFLKFNAVFNFFVSLLYATLITNLLHG